MDPKKTTPPKPRKIESFLLTLLLLILLFAITFGLAYFSDKLKLKKITLNIDNSQSETINTTPTESSQENKSPTNTEVKGCIVSGCNNEICQNEDEEPRASICIFREEFECYKSADCKVQENTGECGWTPTEELINCLNKIPQG